MMCFTPVNSAPSLSPRAGRWRHRGSCGIEMALEIDLHVKRKADSYMYSCFTPCWKGLPTRWKDDWNRFARQLEWLFRVAGWISALFEP